jgi:hypothetical protein
VAARNTADAAVGAEQAAAAPNVTQSLAHVLASGPLSLPIALAYAKEIAFRAAAFHRDGHALGTLSPSRIRVGPNGPIVPAPNGMSHLATRGSDLRDFGLLLYQMLTGLDPADYAPPANTDDDLEPSPRMVRSVALRLVERCCCAPGESDMRHVSTELRLLQVMVSSFDASEVAEAATEERPVEPAAKLVTPAIAAAPAKAAPPARAAAAARPAAPVKPAPPKNRKWGCPSCGSPEYFLSQHLTLLEKLLALVDLKTYRCYRCCQRFINVFGLHVPRPESE